MSTPTCIPEFDAASIEFTGAEMAAIYHALILHEFSLVALRSDHRLLESISVGSSAPFVADISSAIDLIGSAKAQLLTRARKG